MVLSYYLLKLPYAVAWHCTRWIGSGSPVVFYCGTELDLTIFEPVQKHLKPLPIVVKDKKLQVHLKEKGISSSRLPCFPSGVIMVRQAAYKFPVDSIRKICLSHGAYNFKRFASAKSHNLLDAYFFTSKADLKNAQKAGIKSGVAVGYPKLDKAFDGTIFSAELKQLSTSLNIDANKPTVLFTATWDRSGISAVDRWFDQLDKITPEYNVMVTVHPWTSQNLVDRIKNTDKVSFIEGYEVLPYIMIADVCIGDTSSIIGDCCALDKPIITFKVPENERSVSHVMEMIGSIGWQINTLDELIEVLPTALSKPETHSEQRANANKMMFDVLDGMAGKRAADIIVEYFPELALGN